MAVLISIAATVLTLFLFLHLRLLFHRPRSYRDCLPALPSEDHHLCSHRGYGKMGPIAENTLPAYLASHRLGFRLHETDVRRSADGKVILFHGPDLSFTTDGGGRLEKKTSAELSRLDWGYYLRQEKKHRPVAMTTVADLIDNLPGDFINLEMKRDWFDFSGGLERVMAETIRSCHAENRIFTSSFNLLCLLHFRRFSPCGRGLLLESGFFLPLRLWLYSALTLPDFIHLPYTAATEKRLAKLKKRGYGLLFWTVNDPEMASRLVSWGADIICTDNMEMIKARL